MARVGDLLIRVRADIKDLNRKLDRATQKTKKSSDKMAKSLKGTSKASSQLQKRFSNTATAIAALQGPLGPLAGRVRSIGALFGSAGLAIAAVTLAVTLLIAGFRKMIMAAEAANLSMIKFEALMRATGEAAGYTAAMAERLSNKLAKGTLFNLTEVREATAMLLTFKEIGGEAFEDTMDAALNLSTVMRQDLKSSVIQLAKALEAPEIGLSMLRRSGVSFTTAQRDVIVSLALTGKKGEALRLILEQIKGQLGDVAQDMASGTLSGAIDELGRKLQLFNEQFLKSSGIMETFRDKIMALANLLPIIDVTVMSPEELKEGIKESEAWMKRLENTKKELESMGMDSGGGWNWVLANIEKHRKLIEDYNAQLKLLAKENLDTYEEMNKAFLDSQMFAKWEKANNKMKVQISMNAAALGKYGAALDIWKYKKQLYLQLATKGIKVTKEITEAIDILAERLRPMYEELDIAEQAFKGIESAVNKAFSSMENSIIGLIKGTATLKDVMKNIMQQFIADMTVLILKMLILDRIKEKIMGKVGKSVIEGGISAVLGAIFRRQSGGAVNPKTPYMVGEKGPELFIPNSSGRVAPTYHAGNMATANTKPPIVVEQHINFTTGIQSTVRAEVMNLLPQIQNSTISAVQEARVRGGKFAESFGA